MKNIFSFKLYLQGLRKVRVTGIAMAVVMIVLNAWAPIVYIVEKTVWSDIFDFEVHAGLFSRFGFLLLLFAPLLVYNMFSYLNERSASDFFHSLPQKRICVYVSFMSAIVTWIVGALFVSTLVNVILWASAERCTLSIETVTLTMLGCLLLALVAAGFMALSMTLTGTAVANVFVFFLLFLIVRVCGACFVGFFSEITPMFNLDYSVLRVFDWDFFLPTVILEQSFGGDTEVTQSAWFYLYWTVVAVVLLALSAWAYCRRKSESATKSAPNRFMHNVYRICLTFPFAVLGVYIFFVKNEFYFCLLFVLFAVIVWSVFELLTTKKIKNVVRSLPLLLIPAVLAGGYVASIYLSRNIFYASTPEREEIESIRIEKPASLWQPNEYNRGISGFSDAILFSSDVTDPKILDEVYEMICSTKANPKPMQGLGYIYDDAVITVTLKSGREVTYNLHPYNKLDDTFFRSEEFLAHASAFDFEVRWIDSGLRSEEMAHVWEVFKEDFKSLSDERKVEYLHWNNQRAIINREFFTLYGIYQEISFCQHYTPIEEYTPNAYRLYVEYSTENADRSLEELRSAAEVVETIRLTQVYKAKLFVDNPGGMDWEFKCNDPRIIRTALSRLEIDSHLTDYENTDPKKIYRVIFEMDWTDEDGYHQMDLETFFTLSDADLDICKNADWIQIG